MYRIPLLTQQNSTSTFNVQVLSFGEFWSLDNGVTRISAKLGKENLCHASVW